MGAVVTHKGIIVGVGADSVRVRLGDEGQDCGACALAALCSKPQEVEIPWRHPTADLVGRHAVLTISEASHWQAIALFLAIPVAILVVGAILCAAWEVTEAYTALIDLGCVALWFAILYMCRGKLNKKERIRIQSID